MHQIQIKFGQFALTCQIFLPPLMNDTELLFNMHDVTKPLLFYQYLPFLKTLYPPAFRNNGGKNFRMPRKYSFDLVRQLQPYISPDQSSPNYTYLSAEKRVAVTLYYLKDMGSLAVTANTFGIAICTASCVIHQVCNTISKALGPNYLKLPETASEMRQKLSEFEAKFGMVQAFGWIDGTHVPMKRPVKDTQDYYCCKGFYSLNIQAVCDYRGIFMDVNC